MTNACLARAILQIRDACILKSDIDVDLRKSGLDELSSEPAPKLEGLLANAPAPREVGEFAHVAIMV